MLFEFFFTPYSLEKKVKASLDVRYMNARNLEKIKLRASDRIINCFWMICSDFFFFLLRSKNNSVRVLNSLNDCRLVEICLRT